MRVKGRESFHKTEQKEEKPKHAPLVKREERANNALKEVQLSFLVRRR